MDSGACRVPAWRLKQELGREPGPPRGPRQGQRGGSPSPSPSTSSWSSPAVEAQYVVAANFESRQQALLDRKKLFVEKQVWDV